MKTKIEWYKEVLELEPHSKLFFPLARLYVEEGLFDEALETLSAGLRDHPEFLEARLLLLEVLNELGHAGDLSEQVRTLAKTISGYYTFWQAWAHLLTTEQGGKDTALAVNFLASHFQGKSLSWADVIERGIRSLVSEDAASFVFPDSGRAESFTPPQEAPRTEEDVPPTVVAAGEAGEDAPAQEAQDAALDDLMEVDLEQLHAEAGKTPHAADALQDAGVPTSSKDIVDVAAEADKMPASKASQTSFSGEDEEDEDEPFSLRTKTMADLLAEQGDFEGALDIYRELLSVTPPGEGQTVLTGLIKEMSSRIREKKGLQPAQSGKRKAPAKAAKTERAENGGLSGKKKLIDTLELLAQRLEARGTS